MNDQLESPLPEVLQRLLPTCSGCLSDFLACASLQPLKCGHFYCATCLLKIKDKSDTFQCFYDNKPHKELMPEIKPEEVLPALLNSTIPITQSDDLKPYLGYVNLRKVPCKALRNGGVCRWAANCPFSHYPEHYNLVQKFQTGQDENCWECSKCLLTISRRLQICPACEALQQESKSITRSRGKGCMSPRVDQTFQTEEDRVPGSPVGSPLRFRLETGPDGDLLEQRSACCELQ